METVRERELERSREYATNGLRILRKSGPVRALDPSHRPEGSWALGTRMAFLPQARRIVGSGDENRDLKHHDGSYDDGIPEANFLFRSCAETE